MERVNMEKCMNMNYIWFYEVNEIYNVERIHAIVKRVLNILFLLNAWNLHGRCISISNLKSNICDVNLIEISFMQICFKNYVV